MVRSISFLFANGIDLRRVERQTWKVSIAYEVQMKIYSRYLLYEGNLLEYICFSFK